jgi:phosphoenolpyruvate---glycerone phosphotransferase subunit DhaL
MPGLSAAQAAAMMKEVSRGLIARTDDLTQADKAIGDGDHGIGMARGFEAVLARLGEGPAATVEEVFTATGASLMGSIGGAAGAVFGTLFGEGGKALKGRGLFGAEELSLLLGRGLEAVKRRGKAQAGDKTMIDALEPAAQEAARLTGAPLGEALAAASAAAARGLETTKAMVAKTGKARTLGERSLGHVDPGALSMSIILDLMHAHVQQRGERPVR